MKKLFNFVVYFGIIFSIILSSSVAFAVAPNFSVNTPDNPYNLNTSNNYTVDFINTTYDEIE